MISQYTNVQAPKFKIVFLGDSGSGKTSIISQIVDGKFQKYHYSTIGVDFQNRSIIDHNGRELVLQLWDTAGQERFRSLALSYLRGAHCACLVFDVSSIENFKNIRFWHSEVLGYVQDPDDTEREMKICIIANKVDLKKDRVVSKGEVIEIASELGVDFVMGMSAKNGQNIKKFLRKLADEMGTIETPSVTESS